MPTSCLSASHSPSFVPDGQIIIHEAVSGQFNIKSSFVVFSFTDLVRPNADIFSITLIMIKKSIHCWSLSAHRLFGGLCTVWVDALVLFPMVYSKPPASFGGETLLS